MMSLKSKDSENTNTCARNYWLTRCDGNGGTNVPVFVVLSVRLPLQGSREGVSNPVHQSEC